MRRHTYFVKTSWLSEQVATSCSHAEVLNVTVSNRATSFVICAIYRPPNSNLPIFYDELQNHLNRFNNNSQLVLAGDLNIDVMNISKYGVAEYLNLLSGFGLENVIGDFTREESLRTRITGTCIDHIVVRINELKFASGVFKQKVADYYFVSLVVFGGALNEERVDHYAVIFYNNKINKLINLYDWSILVSLDHSTAYQKMVNHYGSIYNKCLKSVRLKQRKRENVWVTAEITKLCYDKDTLE